MIVKPDGSYETRADYPNTNWHTDHPEYFVIDETTQEGRILADKIMAWFPYYTLTTDGNRVADVTQGQKPAEILWPEVIDKRDAAFQKINIMGELVLYLAESEAIKAGKMTEAQRTITGARALRIAMYMRDLYRVKDQADPANIVWPKEPQ